MGFCTSLLGLGIDNTLSYCRSTFFPHQLGSLFAVCNPALVNTQFEGLRFTPSLFCPPIAPRSAVCPTPTPDPLPWWCLASLTADWSALSALLSPPFSSSWFVPFSRSRVFSLLGLSLLRCLISLTADWSGLSALPHPPSPSPPLVWSLEEALAFLTADWSGLSGFSLPTTTTFNC